jgi:hypothetical protein
MLESAHSSPEHAVKRIEKQSNFRPAPRGKNGYDWNLSIVAQFTRSVSGVCVHGTAAELEGLS